MPQNPPDTIKLYHITHMDNLQSIIDEGYLYSNACRDELALSSTNIGMTHIKNRRLSEHEVACHPGTTVGQYVPFYFCFRSMMLYIIYARNHPDLSYRGGQEPIVHLQIDMFRAVEWANTNGAKWAFSDRSAASHLATFYNNLEHLDEIDWTAVAAHNWKHPDIREGKQAEFLLHEQMPWNLVERIGVINHSRRLQVAAILAKADHLPEIAVERTWYY